VHLPRHTHQGPHGLGKTYRKIPCSHLAAAGATPTVDGPREERLPSILVFELGLFEKFGKTDMSEKRDAAGERRGLHGAPPRDLLRRDRLVRLLALATAKAAA
jgi:hypothetical protein